MRVLVIPEDPTLDQYVVKPIIERIFLDLGRTARVDILNDPHISGAAQALDPALISEIIGDNAMIDLFLLVVDRDCDRMGHEAKTRARESEHPGKLIAALAWQEIEVWALALHRQMLPDRWPRIRTECDPKERYWDPLVRDQGWLGTVGKGRKKAMRGLGAGWSGLRQVCPEIEALRERIEAWLQTAP